MDAPRDLDWNRISDDYARYRSGPPPSFYRRLSDYGIGLPGQRLLDLGTGTGVLARVFARAGARVAGIDSSPGQIGQAKMAAAAEGLAIDFRVGPAEATPFAYRSFEAITANQCWHFFDSARVYAEARRLLAPGGALAVSDFFWMAAHSPVAAATEELILKYAPGWSPGPWPVGPDVPTAVKVEYEEPIPFTRESWRGRVRTCRVIGPSLPPERVREFDEEHRRILESTAPERFDVPHRIVIHFYRS